MKRISVAKSSHVFLSLLLFSQAYAQTGCPEGQTYNTNVARCVTTAEASQIAQAAPSCEAQATYDAKKQCYVSAAQSKMNDAVAKGDLSEAGKSKADALSTALTLAGLGSSVAFLASRKGSCPGATSATLIAAGGAAALAGEVLSAKTYKSKMKAAKEKLEKTSASADKATATNTTGSTSATGTNAQAEAFDALIAQEEAVISACKTKKKLYMLSTAAYGAATVMAGMEVFKGSTNQADVNCMTKDEEEAKRTADQNARYAQEDAAETARQDRMKVDPDFKKAEEAREAAEDVPSEAEASSDIIVTATKMTGVSKFVKLYSKPTTRLALAGVLTANNVYMLSKISKEQKKAEKRKQFLEDLRNQVTAAGTTLPSGSSTSGTLGDGTITPTSATGAGATASSDYGMANFCTTSTGKLDEICKCKATNTCLKVSSTLNTSGIGGVDGGLGGLGFGDMGATLDGVNNGSLNGGSLDGDKLAAQAARFSKAAKTLSAKNPAIANAEKTGAAEAKPILAAINSSIAGSPLVSGAGSGFGEASDFPTTAKTPEEALKEIKQEIGAVESAGAAGKGNALDFSGLSDEDLNGDANITDGQLAAAMDENLSVGNADINTDTSASIFQVLSNRYLRSGIPRLWADQLPTTPPAPAAKKP